MMGEEREAIEENRLLASVYYAINPCDCRIARIFLEYFWTWQGVPNKKK